jgi:hypothetical protein
MKTQFVLVPCAVLLLSACSASASVLRTGDYFPPKPQDCALQVMSSFPAPGTYSELGIIHGKAGSGASRHQTLEDMVPAMKTAACGLGADALVIKNVSESSYGQMLYGKIAEADSVAIKYTESKGSTGRAN